MAVQLGVVLLAAALLWRLAAGRGEWRLLVAGATVLALALFALRAAH